MKLSSVLFSTITITGLAAAGLLGGVHALCVAGVATVAAAAFKQLVGAPANRASDSKDQRTLELELPDPTKDQPTPELLGPTKDLPVQKKNEYVFTEAFRSEDYDEVLKTFMYKIDEFTRTVDAQIKAFREQSITPLESCRTFG